MKSDKSIMFYIEEERLTKEYSAFFSDINYKINDVLSIALEHIATYINAKDFVYNVYTEGKIYKALPENGSMAFFVYDTPEQEASLKKIITDNFVENIIDDLLKNKHGLEIKLPLAPWPFPKDKEIFTEKVISSTKKEIIKTILGDDNKGSSHKVKI